MAKCAKCNNLKSRIFDAHVQINLKWQSVVFWHPYDMENYVTVGNAIYSLSAKLLYKITSHNADWNFGIAFGTRAANE